MLEFLGEAKGFTQDPRFTLSTNPSAPKRIEEVKLSRRKVTELLLSGTDIIELANDGSESMGVEKVLTSDYGNKNLHGHKLLNVEAKPELIQLPDYSSTISDIKHPKFRRSIIARKEREKNTQMKAYMQNRMESLKALLSDLKERSERVNKKRELLENLLNKNTEYSMHGSITQAVNEEISTLKLMVCKNPAYLEIINSYVFANKRFGWRIPIDRAFMHLPYLDFVSTQYPLLLRIEIIIDSIKKIDISNTLSILSNDIP